MKLCKCDKCKTEFKPTDHGASTVKLKVYDSNHRSWSCGWDYDLCPVCTKKVEKFLEP